MKIEILVTDVANPCRVMSLLSCRWNAAVRNDMTLPPFVESGFLQNNKVNLSQGDTLELSECVSESKGNHCCGHDPTAECSVAEDKITLFPAFNKNSLPQILQVGLSLHLEKQEAVRKNSPMLG